MTRESIQRVSYLFVVGLSLFSMSLVLGAAVLVLLGKLDPLPKGDEGTAAHLFQLANVLLVPAGLVFLATADWKRPSRIVKRLLVPAVVVVVAFVTLYLLEHPG